MPQRSAWSGIDVRVEGVQALVLRCNEHDIVFYAADRQVGHPERLRINRPIDRAREEFAKVRRGNI
jgi:hypothetical protein